MNRIAEYGTYPDSARAKSMILDSRAPLSEHRAAIEGDVMLIVSTQGYEPAGSAARWTDGYYAVRFATPSGSYNGMRYLNTEEGHRKARAHFERITRRQA